MLCLHFSWSTAATVIQFDSGVQKFLTDYCIKCHDAKVQKGDRSFHKLATIDGDRFSIDLADTEKIHLLRDILDQLNLGEMPPQKKEVQVPKSQEIKSTIAWLTRTLLTLEEEKGTSRTVLRRLNRYEYHNTLRDILGLGTLPFDLTSDFPADEESHGFTNLGDVLNLSERHLDAYLGLADRYLRIAFPFGEPQQAKTLVVKPQDWGYPDREARTPWMYRLHVKDKYLDVGAGKKQLSDHFALGTYPNGFTRWSGGIQTSGYYTISITAEAIRRLTHPYDPKMIPVDLRPPMQLGLYLSRGTKGIASDGVKDRVRLGLWDLLDHKQKTFKVTVWLDKGDIPFLNWDNGPGPSDYWMRDICKKYHTDIEFRGKQGSHAWHIIGKDLVPGRVLSDVWKGPLLRVHDFRVHGPTTATYQSKARRVFLDGEMEPADSELNTAFMRFARRAYRRPVSQKEVEPYLKIATHAREKLGRKSGEAFLLALKAMLISPDFLYMKETTPVGKPLGAFELASRLSYFLWSSLPDNDLFNLAKDGSLLRAEVFRQQVIRMLNDPKSDSLVKGFSTSWLRLDKLGTMPPDAVKFREYYNQGLEEAMLEETYRFTSHALRMNVPLSDFVHSSYGFVNQDLARHYGVDDVVGIHFRKVNYPSDSVRGGLLGQASILTLTANGVDTSPVVRGTWLLENLLGTPPAPPPPDVEPIDPDVRGAKTLKQLLEKHRTVEACADCHAKIDPYGFPLEFFDPVGGYRPTYYKRRFWSNATRTTRLFPSSPVDGSAQLPSGEFFDAPLSLKKVLLTRMDLVSKNLTRKLLTYATGREMTLKDEATIQRIANSIHKDEKGFQDLILQVAMSEVFQNR
ncbi:MAG: DUF1592 domain-containing protein [Opitutae bacterium]